MMLNNPVSEQEICVGCGLCCDGTLFHQALLQPGERGHLPEKIEEQYVEAGDREAFRLPCAYFSGKCTIYDQPRAHICGAFRCRVLHKVADQTLAQQQAMQTVRDALRLRDDLYGLYRQVFGHDYPFHFRQLVADVKQAVDDLPADDPNRRAIRLLHARCTIYEALLLKNFIAPKYVKRLNPPATP